MADCDMRAGAAWLESKQRHGRPLQGCTSGDDLLERLRDVFREAGLDWLDSLRDVNRTSLSGAAFSDAARVAEEYKLGLWMRRQNVAGVAVRTPRLIEEYRKLVDEQPPAVPLKSVPQLENSTGRNWARRWRRCQVALYGKLRTEEAVAREEKRAKVGATRDRLHWRSMASASMVL